MNFLLHRPELYGIDQRLPISVSSPILLLMVSTLGRSVMFRDSQEQSHSDEPRFSQLPSVPPRLSVEIEPGTAVTLSLAEQVVVGRSDGDDTASDLGFDLAAYGGDKTGVSRRHAVFSWRDDAVWIEDLESTNGTRINGLKLTPNHPYRLHDGDEIELGSARLMVRFVPVAD